MSISLRNKLPLRQFNLQNIDDINTRQAFQYTRDYLDSIPFIKGNFVLFDMQFKSDIVQQLIPHNLGILPLDVIQTYLTGTGSISFVYNKFTDTNLAITTSGTNASDPLRVRFFRWYNKLMQFRTFGDIKSEVEKC